MVSLRLAAAIAAVGLFTSSMAFAEGAKPNDAQIAHIAYTACGISDLGWALMEPAIL
jgi:hypothetical protein